MKAKLNPKRALPLTEDRRRHPRYRYSAPVTVRCADGSERAAMSLEMSESGMSLLLPGTLQVGEEVQLEPIVGAKVTALVRHQVGKVHGFEFVNLTDGQVRQIRANCTMLPVFRAKSLDI
jgi:hypothetical protein